MTPFRLLLVEDFEPFRRFVRSALQPRPELLIVGEAVDGLEAVQKARILQPDLILLDIGLPKLNGFAAAEQIRAFAPQALFLFISLESSSAAVAEAFRGGAQGYIHKLRAQFDLLPAIEAVLAGKQFVSSNLEFGDTTKARRHEVHFYSDDALLLKSTTRFISDVLKANGAAIVLASASHRQSIDQTLKADACDVEAAARKGTYVSVNAAEALSKLQAHTLSDYDRFCESLGSVIESCVQATKTEHPRVAVFGECCGLLCAKGNPDAAIRIEKKGNDLVKTYGVELMCSYPLSAFERVNDGNVFKIICAEHTAVFC